MARGKRYYITPAYALSPSIEFVKTQNLIEDVATKIDESLNILNLRYFKDVIKKLENIQDEFRNTLANLNAKKGDIS